MHLPPHQHSSWAQMQKGHWGENWLAFRQGKYWHSVVKNTITTFWRSFFAFNKKTYKASARLSLHYFAIFQTQWGFYSLICKVGPWKEEEGPWDKKSTMGLTKFLVVEELFKKKKQKKKLTLIFGMHENFKIIFLLFFNSSTFRP